MIFIQWTIHHKSTCTTSLFIYILNKVCQVLTDVLRTKFTCLRLLCSVSHAYVVQSTKSVVVVVGLNVICRTYDTPYTLCIYFIVIKWTVIWTIIDRSEYKFQSRYILIDIYGLEARSRMWLIFQCITTRLIKMIVNEGADMLYFFSLKDVNKILGISSYYCVVGKSESDILLISRFKY